MDVEDALDRAAEAIVSADALLIGAGAGMGVDSGLPDFRGPEGFWKAYPAFRGRQFSDMSNPVWFHRDPEQAWGFFGHRMHLYRDAVPHTGFDILREWMARVPEGGFVFTSNVDRQFAKAGFDEDRLFEVHGSLGHLQCVALCTRKIWSADRTEVAVEMESVRATGALPRCPDCDGLARPNVLMFGDYEWLSLRSDAQERRYAEWMAARAGQRVVAVEMGAGTSIPTVRYECEHRSDVLIRINPRDPEVPDHGIGLALGAREALERIHERLP